MPFQPELRTPEFSFKATLFGLLSTTSLILLINDLSITKPNDQFSICLYTVPDIVDFPFFLKHFLLLASITLLIPSYLTGCPFSVSLACSPIFLTSKCWVRAQSLDLLSSPSRSIGSWNIKILNFMDPLMTPKFISRL